MGKEFQGKVTCVWNCPDRNSQCQNKITEGVMSEVGFGFLFSRNSNTMDLCSTFRSANPTHRRSYLDYFRLMERLKLIFLIWFWKYCKCYNWRCDKKSPFLPTGMASLLAPYSLWSLHEKFALSKATWKLQISSDSTREAGIFVNPFLGVTSLAVVGHSASCVSHLSPPSP